MGGQRVLDELWAELIDRIAHWKAPKEVIAATVERQRKVVFGAVKSGDEAVTWELPVSDDLLTEFGAEHVAMEFQRGMQVLRETVTWVDGMGAIKGAPERLQRQLAFRWIARLITAISEEEGGGEHAAASREIVGILDGAHTYRPFHLPQVDHWLKAYDDPYYANAGEELRRILDEVAVRGGSPFPDALLVLTARVFPALSDASRTMLREAFEEDLMELLSHAQEGLPSLNGPPSDYVRPVDLHAMALRFRFEGDVDAEQAAGGLRDFIMALNRLHVLEGGKGLTIDDWRVRETEPDFAGMPQ